MSFTKYRILIYSENPDKLMAFYKDTLNLKLLNKLDLPEDYGYLFQVAGDMNLWIGKHSEIKGNVKENYRHLFNLYPIEGVNYWYDKIRQSRKVTVVAKPYLAPFSTKDNNVWFCTFLDPEGNCWQFVGKK